MAYRFDQPLSRPIALRSGPARTLDTLLSAVEFLSAGTTPRTDEINAALDLIMAAASSCDPVLIERATSAIEDILRDRGKM